MKIAVYSMANASFSASPILLASVSLFISSKNPLIRHLIHEYFYMTIKDIARLAGVSTTTVSRVINNSKGVCKESKQKVLAIIEKYAFQPNLYAHRLAMHYKEESLLQLELFIEDLEKQGMPKHCGECNQYLICSNHDHQETCPWLKRYRDWQDRNF